MKNDLQTFFKMELSEIIPHIEALVFASDKPLTIIDIVELINDSQRLIAGKNQCFYMRYNFGEFHFKKVCKSFFIESKRNKLKVSPFLFPIELM